MNYKKAAEELREFILFLATEEFRRCCKYPGYCAKYYIRVKQDDGTTRPCNEHEIHMVKVFRIKFKL